MVTEDGWTRLHRGHKLDRDDLRDDLVHNQGEPLPGHDLHVDEWNLGYAPRVKWCEQYGWPCNQEGDWHAHWYQAKPSESNAFSVASWQHVYAEAPR
jgi:hypothetical protein